MTSQTHFVTGANRGIGRALVEVLLAQGHIVVGACRKPGALQGLSHPNLKVVALDVDDDASATACASAVAAQVDRLDSVLNVAGILPQPYDAPLERLDLQLLRDAFETNVLGPLRVTRALLPLLRKGVNPRVVNVTSGVGSIERTDNPHFYAYGPSKAALNKVSRTLAFELKPAGITVVALDPGWVQTDMGGAAAPLKPQESAAAIAATLMRLDLTWTGKYIYNNGDPIPW
jgi:NAD(P)-dependent dehydrogenase (short-subunit alcohol dehydrogenase family)